MIKRHRFCTGQATDFNSQEPTIFMTTSRFYFIYLSGLLLLCCSLFISNCTYCAGNQHAEWYVPGLGVYGGTAGRGQGISQAPATLQEVTIYSISYRAPISLHRAALEGDRSVHGPGLTPANNSHPPPCFPNCSLEHAPHYVSKGIIMAYYNSSMTSFPTRSPFARHM